MSISVGSACKCLMHLKAALATLCEQSVNAPPRRHAKRPRRAVAVRDRWGAEGTRNGGVSSCRIERICRGRLACSPACSPALPMQQRDIEPPTVCHRRRPAAMPEWPAFGKSANLSLMQHALSRDWLELASLRETSGPEGELIAISPSAARCRELQRRSSLQTPELMQQRCHNDSQSGRSRPRTPTPEGASGPQVSMSATATRER